jgi:hypothetical protein
MAIYFYDNPPSHCSLTPAVAPLPHLNPITMETGASPPPLGLPAAPLPQSSPLPGERIAGAGGELQEGVIVKKIHGHGGGELREELFAKLS